MKPFLVFLFVVLNCYHSQAQVKYKWHKDTANHFCFQVPAKWVYMTDEDGLNNGYFYYSDKDIREGKEPLLTIDGWLQKPDSSFMSRQGFSKDGAVYYTGWPEAYNRDTAIVIKGVNWKGYYHPATRKLFFYNKKQGIIDITAGEQGLDTNVWNRIIKSFRFL
jgi:hypothetical protein